MPEKKTLQRAAKRKSPSSQAGEFVREEIEHVREGKHGARSAKQAIAIGLSKARQAGVKLPPPPGKKGAKTPAPHRPDPNRSRATLKALKKESTKTVSPGALSKQAKASAAKRGPAKREAAAKKAARTRARND